MADKNEKVKDQTEENQEKGDEKKDAEKKGDKKAKKDSNGKSSLRGWILIALIVTVCSAGGGVAANIFLSPSSTPSEASENEAPGEDIIDKDGGETKIPEDFAYYEFESLTANLNVQRMDRYVNATIVLAFASDNKDEITEMLEKKMVMLRSWIRIFLAGHTLEQIKGNKNMIRIQREIANAFNEQLWPNQKPRINHVLFKEFAIQ